MPRKIGQASEPKAQKMKASKPIRKEPKVNNRQNVIDQQVLGSKSAVHYILILDNSYSMEGKPWGDLRKATEEFLRALANSREANSCKVSCVIYDDQSKIAFEDEKPCLGLIDRIQFEGGFTQYGPAMRHAFQICERTATKSDKLVFYFMSDGQPQDSADAEVEMFRRQNYFNKI